MSFKRNSSVVKKNKTYRSDMSSRPNQKKFSRLRQPNGEVHHRADPHDHGHDRGWKQVLWRQDSKVVQ
jgi:hypothetical protein